MTITRIPAVIVLTVVLLSGCAQPPPFGLSQAEWEALPAEDRRELLDLEGELDSLARDEREARIQAEERRRDRFCAYGVGVYCDH